MPPELRYMAWTQSVLQNEAVDLSLHENHRGAAAAQLRRDYFQLYWRYNTFYLPSSPDFSAVLALDQWCHGMLSDNIAAEMTHADAGRHILVEVGIHCKEDDVPDGLDYGPLAMKLNKYSVNNLFQLVKRMGPRAAQVIRITCVFVTRRSVRATPGHPSAFACTDTKAPAPEPIKSRVERYVHHVLDRYLYRMVARDQNGDPTPDAMVGINRWILSQDKIIYQNSRQGQLLAACQALEQRVCESIEDDLTNQTNYDILCAAYHNAVQTP